MTGFNHAASGALIGKFLPLPIALPVALGSHFVLDKMPHYGIPHHHRDSKFFWKLFTTADVIAAFGLGGLAIYFHRYAMFACGFVACSPDFIWLARVVRTKSFDLSQNEHRFTKWHVRIQNWERPWGIWIELPLSVGMFYLIWNFGFH